MSTQTSPVTRRRYPLTMVCGVYRVARPTVYARTAAPAGRDIATVGNYLVVTNTDDDQTVQWSGFNDIDTWPAANKAILSDTPGTFVGVRALSPLSMAIYKDDAVYLGTLQAARIAFQFQLIDTLPGPVSPSAIVSYRGVHYWLALDGGIYLFDGTSRPRLASKGAISTLIATHLTSQRLRAHGHPLRRAPGEIWWHYPQAGGQTRALSFNTETHAINPHVLGHNITASSQWEISSALRTIDGLVNFSTSIDGLASVFATIDEMGSAGIPVSFVADDNGNYYRFNIGNDDGGTAIAWEFIHGFRLLSELKNRFYLDGIASYWTQTAAALTTTMGVTVSDEVSDMESESTSTFNLSTAGNHLTAFRGNWGKWLKVRHAGSSVVSGMEHRGAVALAWLKGMI